ncbi:MAG: aldo/keto reductase [Alphaproteobacteria bacterium]|jgi:aryl-alcohol dehydrogenase-like predicted oxidoreductase|tara:strand:+ start:3414 stop:4442 length:1029 start_codon:yes stop_codon:yes gene_type:complete
MKKLNYKKLGLTSIKVSEIGFGGAGIGHAWGKTDDRECIKCINEAIDNGINFFDTSPVYGNGKSEINLGIGLQGKREKVVIASKVRFDNQMLLKSMKENLVASVEESLKRLKTDYIDILQIHHQIGSARGEYQFRDFPPAFAPQLDHEDCLDFFQASSDLVSQGKVRFIGLTGWNGDFNTVKKLIETNKFTTIQILYNLLNQSADGVIGNNFDDINQGYDADSKDNILQIADDNKIGVIGIRSHAAGALVDKLDRKIDKLSVIYRDYKRAHVLKKKLSQVGLNLSEIALIYCLKQPKITTVVPGIKNMLELKETLGCLEKLNLSLDELSLISDWYKELTSYY